MSVGIADLSMPTISSHPRSTRWWATEAPTIPPKPMMTTLAFSGNSANCILPKPGRQTGPLESLPPIRNALVPECNYSGRCRRDIEKIDETVIRFLHISISPVLAEAVEKIGRLPTLRNDRIENPVSLNQSC